MSTQVNMLRFRPKLGSERGSEWRCFFCLHVRTGTILLGTWHLMLHLLALVFLAAIVRDPRLMDELDRDSAPGLDRNDVGIMITSAVSTPITNLDTQTNTYSQHNRLPRDHSLIYNDVDVGALVTVCTLAITLMLIYGAARGKPAQLLPFFCLQIFDFAITVLTATGYLCYLRSIHQLVAETRRMPWSAELLQLPAPVLALVVLSAFLIAVLLKGYCISVVWRCYKYLTMHAMQHITPYVISSSGTQTAARAGDAAAGTGAGASGPAPAPDYSSLLPDYEEAVKQTPPPSYRAATLMAVAEPAIPADQPPQHPQPAPIPSNTMVVLPQLGTQARV